MTKFLAVCQSRTPGEATGCFAVCHGIAGERPQAVSKVFPVHHGRAGEARGFIKRFAVRHG